MKKLTIALIFLTTTLLNAGPIKDFLKQRFMDKKSKEPAPASSELPTGPFTPGDFVYKIKVNNTDRYFKIHIPETTAPTKSETTAVTKSDAPPTTPKALWIALHGGGGNMNIQSDDQYYKLISKSDKEGFIAVFPNGTSRFNSGELATWNAGKCCGYARDSKADDVGFIKTLITEIKKHALIDPKRIIISGMSNGAMMGYRLACEIPELFTHLAAVAGTDNTTVCEPSKKVSILHIHAKDDAHVQFHGGAGKDAVDKELITDFTSVPDTLAKWKKINHCPDTTKSIIKDKDHQCDLTPECADHTQIQLCTSETGGHSWPGGKKPRNRGPTPANFSANDLIWNFVNQK